MSTRDLTRARVFEIIHLFEPVSRSEIAKHMGMSSPAISYIVTELLDRGFIVELGRRSSVRGQPAIELGVAGKVACTMGLHFTHEDIRGVVIDLKGKILSDIRAEFPESRTPKAVLDTLLSISQRLKASAPKNKLLGIGLASVGPIDLIEGSVTQMPFDVDWHNVALRQPLAEALKLPVYMDNNATAASIGEYWYGVGHGYSNFLHISFLGNLLGGGLFLNRRVYRGTGLNAAEFGHMLVTPTKPLKGVAPFLENYVSGFALQRDLGSNVMSEFSARLENNEDELNAWLDQASDMFAKAIVSVDHVLDLDAIIVGGQLPVSFLSELIKRVEQRFDDLYMPGWSKRACLRLSANCADIAVLGAATLPIYDVLALTSHAASVGASVFKSDSEIK